MLDAKFLSCAYVACSRQVLSGGNNNKISKIFVTFISNKV